MVIKPLISVSVALGALLFLSACDSVSDEGETATNPSKTAIATETAETTPESPATVTVTAEPSVSTAPAASVLPADDPGDFLQSAATQDMIIRDAFSAEGINVPAGIGLDYAQVACQGLRDGLSPDDVAFAGMMGFPQFDYLDHMYMIGVSIAAVCPEYM